MFRKMYKFAFYHNLQLTKFKVAVLVNDSVFLFFFYLVTSSLDNISIHSTSWRAQHELGRAGRMTDKHLSPDKEKKKKIALLFFKQSRRGLVTTGPNTNH